jgi:hypothetical protein
MAISSPENSCGERTSTRRLPLASEARTSSRLARMASSPGRAVNVCGGCAGASVLVGRPSAIHFSRGPLTSLTLSWP